MLHPSKLACPALILGLGCGNGRSGSTDKVDARIDDAPVEMDPCTIAATEPSNVGCEL